MAHFMGEPHDRPAVEVKAGSGGTLKSLRRFLARDLRARSEKPTALRFDLNVPSVAELEHELTDGTPVQLGRRLSVARRRTQ